MLVSPFLSVGQAEIMMMLNHHAYRINVMDKNERDRSGFECQFLFRYLACNRGRFLAHFDVGTPHGRMLHWIEQALATQIEQVIHMRTWLRQGTKIQGQDPTDEEEKLSKDLSESTHNPSLDHIINPSKSTARHAYTTSTLTCSMKSNNRESQRKSNNLNHHPSIRNEARSSNRTKQKNLKKSAKPSELAHKHSNSILAI